MTKIAPEPDLKNISDDEMAQELAGCVDYFEEREKTAIESNMSERLMERLARHKAACRAMSTWLRSWSAAGCGRDSENKSGLFDL